MKAQYYKTPLMAICLSLLSSVLSVAVAIPHDTVIIPLLPLYSLLFSSVQFKVTFSYHKQNTYRISSLHQNIMEGIQGNNQKAELVASEPDISEICKQWLNGCLE